MKRKIVLLMALIAMLMDTPFNAGAQTIIPKSRFSAAQIDQKVREYNLVVMAIMCRYENYGSMFSGGAPELNVSYPKGTPLYYYGIQRGIIKVIGYKKVSKFGEIVKGDTAWTRECTYENGQLKNVRYKNGIVEIYNYDNYGRIIKVARYNPDGSHILHLDFSITSLYLTHNYYHTVYWNDGTSALRNDVTAKFEVKDNGYYLYSNEYRNSDHYEYGSQIDRTIYSLDRNSVNVTCHWRYKELTIKGRLAGKKYNWQYDDCIKRQYDKDCFFLSDNDYIIEYEQVL